MIWGKFYHICTLLAWKLSLRGVITFREYEQLRWMKRFRMALSQSFFFSCEMDADQSINQSINNIFCIGIIQHALYQLLRDSKRITNLPSGNLQLIRQQCLTNQILSIFQMTVSVNIASDRLFSLIIYFDNIVIKKTLRIY